MLPKRRRRRAINTGVILPLIDDHASTDQVIEEQAVEPKTASDYTVNTVDLKRILRHLDSGTTVYFGEVDGVVTFRDAEGVIDAIAGRGRLGTDKTVALRREVLLKWLAKAPKDDVTVRIRPVDDEACKVEFRTDLYVITFDSFFSECATSMGALGEAVALEEHVGKALLKCMKASDQASHSSVVQFTHFNVYQNKLWIWGTDGSNLLLHTFSDIPDVHPVAFRMATIPIGNLGGFLVDGDKKPRGVLYRQGGVNYKQKIMSSFEEAEPHHLLRTLQEVDVEFDLDRDALTKALSGVPTNAIVKMEVEESSVTFHHENDEPVVIGHCSSGVRTVFAAFASTLKSALAATTSSRIGIKSDPTVLVFFGATDETSTVITASIPTKK